MAYIQGYNQQWTTDPGGSLQSFNANPAKPVSAAPAPQQPSAPEPSEPTTFEYPTNPFGGINPRYFQQQLNNQVKTANEVAAATAPPAFGGLAATPGGSMTFDGKQYTAKDGSWVPVESGMQDPLAGGGPWNSGIPDLGQKPFEGQAGGRDMLGNYTLNNRNFTSLEDANALAKALGANVVLTNYEDGSRTPEYNLDFGRGTPLNAGQLAYYFGPNSSFSGIRNEQDRIAAIKRSIEDELRYNDSPMERQIADQRDQFSIFKDAPGGYQSGVKTGSGAPALSDNSFWQNTSPMPWQSAAGPQLPSGMQGGLQGAPGTWGQQPQQPSTRQPFPQQAPYPGGGGVGGGSANVPQQRVSRNLFNMSPDMNNLYYLNQSPNNRLGGLGYMGQGGQFSPFGAAGFGGFGGQMPFTMGGMPGFMGLSGGFGSDFNGGSYYGNPPGYDMSSFLLSQLSPYSGGMQNPLSGDFGGGFMSLLQGLAPFIAGGGFSGLGGTALPAGYRSPGIADSFRYI